MKMIKQIDADMIANTDWAKGAYIEVHLDGVNVSMTVYPEHQNHAPALIANGYRKKIVGEIIKHDAQIGLICAQALMMAEKAKQKEPTTLMMHVVDPKTFKKNWDGEQDMQIPERIVQRMGGNRAIDAMDIMLRFEINRTGDEKFPQGFIAAYFALAIALHEHDNDWDKAWFQRIRVNSIVGLMPGAMGLDASEDGHDPHGVPFEFTKKLESIMPQLLELNEDSDKIGDFVFPIVREHKRWSNIGIPLFRD